jgi:hypothetical protein
MDLCLLASALIRLASTQIPRHRQTFLDTAAHHALEHMPERLAVPEAAMAILREGGVIRHLAVQATRRASADFVAERCDAAMRPELGEKRKRASCP